MSSKGFKVSCPECGTTFDILHALEDVEARRFMGLLAETPPTVVKPIIRYLKLFRPAKQAMRWSRLVTLLQELLPMIKEAQVERNRISYVVTHAQWAEAMTNLVENPPKTLQLPLTGHGYLISILAGSAEKVAAQAERKAETDKQYHYQEGRSGGPTQVTNFLSQEENQSRMAELKKQMGRDNDA